MEMTITEFLEARISEDEAVATAALWENSPGYDPEDDDYDNPWSTEHGEFAGRGGANFRHILHNNPSRVLAECAAKRAIIAEYDGLTFEQRKTFDSWEPYRSVMRNTLTQLAKVYQAHPDYRQEWEIG